MSTIKMEVINLYRKIKENFIFFAVNLLVSVILYFLMISNQLVNSNDGLWEYNYYKAGSWSLSLGRWFLLYIDRLRFGISVDPLTSLITLACFSAGFIFIQDLFELGKGKLKYLVSLLFMSSTVICITLSYRFTSPAYGLAFLLSALAAWLVIKCSHKLLGVVAGGVFIALSMGLYQSYIGCTSVILLGYFIVLLQKQNVDLKVILIDIVKSLLSAAVGGLLYIGILNIHLKVFHVSMSQYNGANSYSLGNTIKNLPGSIVHAYKVFSRYFLEGYFKSNVLQEFGIYFVVFLIAFVVLVVGLVRSFRIEKIRAVLYVLCMAAIPVATNVVLLIATGAWTTMLMTAPMALCIPILLCVETAILTDKEKCKCLTVANIGVLILLLYGNIYQVQIDQEAMLEGKIATTTMAQEIIHDLNDNNCLDADLKYCILGTPAANEMFQTSVIYEKANGDAMFGAWYSDISCTRRSWQGVFSYLCGINLQICTVSEYGRVLAEDSVTKMAVYPNDGYIMKMDDIVVIKVAE